MKIWDDSNVYSIYVSGISRCKFVNPKYDITSAYLGCNFSFIHTLSLQILNSQSSHPTVVCCVPGAMCSGILVFCYSLLVPSGTRPMMYFRILGSKALYETEETDLMKRLSFRQSSIMTRSLVSNC